jgi:hypothetical protein
MNKQKIIVQDNINRLTKMIELAKKDENHNPDTLKKYHTDLSENQRELSRILKIEWEETHERLDFGDDR